MVKGSLMISAAVLWLAVWPAAAQADELPAARLIGGIGLTHLTVYEQRPAPDGVNSGSPHVHAITDEAYYVISGTGRAELHDVKHGFRTVDIEPGQYLQFPPCVLHRIVSTDKLVILAVMGNAGLAERGDARIYFGKAVDEDPDEYARLAGLAKEKGLEGALDRRDASVRAYQGLLKLWENDPKAYTAELQRFTGVHLKAMEKLRSKLSEAVSSGPLYWGLLSQIRLRVLPEGEDRFLAAFHDGEPKIAYGMCGVLRPVSDLKPLSEVCLPGADEPANP